MAIPLVKATRKTDWDWSVLSKLYEQKGHQPCGRALSDFR